MRRPMLIALTLAGVLSAIAVLAGGAPPVTYFDARQVSAAFEKGAVLFGGDGLNYMVHASRREAPGQCEIHTRDTDIIYVLDGSTTFVTGGACSNATATAPDEIRGTAVENGEERRLVKGDVIIVPRNTPHWFKAVDGLVLYYVVKVR